MRGKRIQKGPIFAEKEQICTMTETEIKVRASILRQYIGMLQEEQEQVITAAQNTIDLLAEMAAVLTVGIGNDIAPPGTQSPSAQTEARSGGIVS